MTPGIITILYVSAAVAGGLAAAIVWRRRGKPGATPLAWMLAASAFWAACDAVELWIPTVPGRRVISQLQYLGVISAAPLFLHAAIGLAGRRAPLPVIWVVAIWIIPALTLLVAWTSSAHDWLWTAIRLPDGGIGPGVYEYGWWFWVLTADHYVLSAAGLAVLVRATRRVRSAFRAPLLLVTFAIALPWVGNIIYVFKLGPWRGVNLLALSVIASGLVFAWLAVREGLFDTIPAAREAVIELIPDAVVVVDDGGQLLMCNPAARQLFGIRPGDPPSPELLEALALSPDDSHDGPVDMELEGQDGARWLEVHRGDVQDRWGRPAAHLLVARDITARKQVEHERLAVIKDLTAALGRIDTLEGLLPICAQCKKIRDDDGTWRKVEAYFESRTNVEFTHGICPECSHNFFKTIPQS